jgi:hypothetical protein
MFDNPNEELQKLEQQLLAAEEKGDDFESFYQDILSEFGPESQKQPPRQSAPAASAKHAYSDQPKKKSGKPSGKKKTKKKKKKSLKGLVITLCLECVGILGIILWWLLRML